MSKCKRSAVGRQPRFILFFLALLLIQVVDLAAQQEGEGKFSAPIGSDTTIVPIVPPGPIDTLLLPALFLTQNADSLADSAESADFINASIFYDAEDSIALDAIHNKVMLYGKAVVKFQTMRLEADYIEYSFSTNEACANGVLDSLGVLQGKPKFDDEGQSFIQEYMCYNFRTKKGFSRKSVTQEGDIVFHAAQSKRHSNEWVHIKGGKFTTCDAENPHFHFHLTKAIIVPQKKIISGPMYMKVRKVPLPLALPFAWFPNKNESTHGVIFPGYGNANDLGYFLKDGGYYFPIGQVADVRLLGDIYSRGSWSLANITNYNKRYKFNGAFSISRTVIRRSLPELPDFSRSTEFFVRWNHTQDPKARPNSNFSTNVNFGTANNFRNNLNSSQADYLTNTFTSSAQWNKMFPGTPYSLAVNARHTQNSATGNVELLVPGITVNRNRTNLPVSKWLGKKVSGRKWYDQIGVTYAANFENLLTEQADNVRFDRFGQLARSTRNGVRQTATVSSQAKLGFVTFTPTFNYNEFWTFKHLAPTLNPDGNTFALDTLDGFRSARDWRLSGSFNTRFYGMFNFKNGKNLKALRHVITPQAGVSYVPSFDRRNFFYNDQGDLTTYNEFDMARFRPSNTNEQFNINFSVANNLEAKMRDKAAGGRATKKVRLIENYVVSGSYNMIADSLNLSDISMRGFTTLFNNLTINYNSTYSAYDRDANGLRVNRYLAETQGKLLRMTRSAVAFGWNFRSKSKSGSKKPEELEIPEEQLEIIERNRHQFVDFNVPWSLNVNYSLNLNRRWNVADQADENDITQSILFNGDFSVLEKWKVGFDSGYDLVAREFTPTSVNVYWDLHCWELTFNWIPFGFRRSFSLQVNVKSAILSDLKLQARGGAGQGLLF